MASLMTHINFAKRCLAVLACCSVLLFTFAFEASAAAANLEKLLKTEKSKAAERKASLERLTAEERTLNKDLEKAEKLILDIEQKLASQQQNLGGLLESDNDARQEYKKLLAEKTQTEQAQAELFSLLWELVCAEWSVGGRDMADWDRVDREYRWSEALFRSLDTYRIKLEKEEAALAEVLGRREKISKAMQVQLAEMDNEKKQLLQARIDYAKRLTVVRKQKQSTTDELAEIVKLVDSLNLQIEEQSGEIQKQKGRLPWPVQGTVKKRFNLKVEPPFRGYGIATGQNAEVVAVAKGVVVHNDIARGFGRVVIIQHGKEYYSLYAFLGESSLQVGTNVRSRQRIGKTGVYPDVGNHGIYFELRFNQKAINPEQWLAS